MARRIVDVGRVVASSGMKLVPLTAPRGVPDIDRRRYRAINARRASSARGRRHHRSIRRPWPARGPRAFRHSDRRHGGSGHAGGLHRIGEQRALDPYRGEEVVPGARVQTEAEILDFIRQNSQTAYHPIGTCRMEPASAATVVDEKLWVHGIEGLRVADASIFPTMPSGNTNAPSIMVGERAADLIKETA
jgi:choline dehydrogenase-like flavoprotein